VIVLWRQKPQKEKLHLNQQPKNPFQLSSLKKEAYGFCSYF